MGDAGRLLRRFQIKATANMYRYLTPAVLDQLELCRDDDARRLLLKPLQAKRKQPNVERMMELARKSA